MRLSATILDIKIFVLRNKRKTITVHNASAVAFPVSKTNCIYGWMTVIIFASLHAM